MGLYIRPNNVSGRLIFSYRCHCATTYRSRTNRPTGCRPMVGWLVGWIDLYKIYSANIAQAPKLSRLSNWLVQVPANGRRANYRRRVSRDWFPQFHWTPAESARPSREAPPSAAAIGCRAVTGTGQAGGHRHIGPWECESAHRTLGMRMRASDPGNTNAYKLSCLSCLC